MTPAILGIDVSKDTLDLALLLDERPAVHLVVANGPAGFARLTRWLAERRVGRVHACLEATGCYGEALAEYLYQQGHRVSVVNPARIKRYADSKLHRSKNDRADARLIAEFCAKEQPQCWQPLPEPVRQLRALVRRLDDLQTAYQQERNRQHALAALPAAQQHEWVAADLAEHLAYLQQRIRSAKAAIQAWIQQHPPLAQQQTLLASIVGIGPLTAARLLAEIGDVTRFESAAQLGAYAGLTPKGFRSGSSVFRHAHISKEGPAFLRYLLYMPALAARRHNPIIRAFCDRLVARKLSAKAVLTAAMRKLLHLVFGVLKHNQPFDPHYLDPSPASP